MLRFILPDGTPSYDMPLYRPPSEAYSLIFQTTLGCSHNRCAFCYMYREKKFRVRPREEVINEIKTAADADPRVNRIFFADGDALVMKTDRLVEYAELCYKSFPSLERISVYGTPQNFLNKLPEELLRIKKAGISLAYFGVESGDPEILKLIDKGVTPDEMAEAALKAKDAGIALSVTTIVGLGGKENSERHAESTGKFISRIAPEYASALTLMLGPFEEQYKKEYGTDWTPLDKFESLREIKRIVDNIEVKEDVIFRSNHASNWLALKGTLPKDKTKLLKLIEATLADPNSPHWRAEEWRGL